MRSDDEDDEDEYDEENEEDEDELRANGVAGGEDDPMEFYEEDGSAEEDDDAEPEDEDDDEDEDEGEGEGEEDDDEEDEDDEEHSEDDVDGEDVDMANGDEASSNTSGDTTKDQPRPPHLARRSLFVPPFTTPPSSLSVEAIVAIPLPTPVYSLATSSCCSYLLAGGSDGYVRAYDFWGSVNGNQPMTAQQRSLVGLGEGVNKAGVVRGWWANEVEGIRDGAVSKRMEAVYSMAMEGDGLWSLSGTQSGPINLHTLRHSPGHLAHSMKGHSNVVSCMSLLPGEKGFLSGSWDGTVREWDLNTGQTVRSYPTHGAQLSSISLRPYAPLTPTPSPEATRIDEDGEGGGNAINFAVTAGPDFAKTNESSEDTGGAAATTPKADSPVQTEKVKDVDADVTMSQAPSPYDPLFDDDADADGETVLPSGNVTMPTTPGINDMAPPSPPAVPQVNPSRPKTSAPGLALPGAPAVKQEAAPSSAAVSGSSTPLFSLPQPVASTSREAAATIPALSRDTYKAFSDDVFMTSSMDGQVVLIDRRVRDYEGSALGVGRLMPGERAPPWCMSACWSGNGNQVMAGRRNGTIDIWDVRRTSSSSSSSSSSPGLLRTLRTPTESGPISCIVALPDGRHVATASQDNIRLWNTHDCFAPDDIGGAGTKKKGSRPPFKIIAGHHGGTISSMLVDPTCRFLITASGDRGWQGESTKVMLIHEIKY